MQTFKTSECKDERILHLANLLKENGFGEFADNYYNEGHSDFFKVTKGEEGIAQIVYIDIDDEEYSVHAFYGHEHVQTAEQAVDYLKGLYSGELAEIAFVLPFCRATAFIKNNAPQDDLVHNFIETIAALLQKGDINLDMTGHFHILTSGAVSMVKIDGGQFEMPEDAELYVRIAVMGNESDDIHIYQ